MQTNREKERERERERDEGPRGESLARDGVTEIGIELEINAASLGGVARGQGGGGVDGDRGGGGGGRAEARWPDGESINCN